MTQRFHHLVLGLTALVATAVCAVAFLIVLTDHGVKMRYHLDLDVYRHGAQAILAGESLYAQDFLTQEGWLPFTYPPAAAYLFLPLAAVPLPVAGILHVLVSIALCALILWLSLRACGTRHRGFWVLVGLPLALAMEPVWQSIMYGQINLVLAALVLVDCLVLLPAQSRWRGVLVGLAAAIKLTPLVFVAVFVARRDWRGVIGVITGAVALTALGALLRPRDSMRYFGGVLGETERIGNPEFAANQSLAGVLARLGITDTWVWLLAAVAVGVVIVVALEQIMRANVPGRDVLLLVCASMAAGLASPVSWSHHWVWWLPGLIVAAVLGHHLRDWALLAGAIAVGVYARWWWLLPHGNGAETTWPWWAQLLGASYPILGLAFLVACIRLPRVNQRTSSASGSGAYPSESSETSATDSSCFASSE